LKAGSLSAIEFPAEAAPLTVVLFHGYGADGADLAPLAREVAQERPLRWLFPDAPVSLEESGMGGRAWFDIDVEALRDYSKALPAGMAEAREAALGFLSELGLPWESLVLGGFSQGAMLATELALSAPRAPRGLMILSGSLVDEQRWTGLAGMRKGLPFFQSHGSADPILSFHLALRLEALLRAAGLEGSLLRFEGGHSIPSEVVSGMGAFLHERS
jgi:phospholipase/carboxylesterase